MIAKIIPRKQGIGSFKDSVNYNLGLSKNERDKVEYVNTCNIFEPSVAIREMEAVAIQNTLSKDPVFNCILSWRESEIPTREQADEAVDIVLNELGLEGCQVHYALHRNTENLHLHICVNRIDPETYKARDPAGGWTKKALERAARKIELAQGWEIEQTGRYFVTAEGQIIEKSQQQDGVKLSQTARDIEAHTATKSAERIAQEIAAPVIREAKSWEELHQNLAAQGIRFERKGSGAILRIGDIIVKASQAGRDISLSKLETRLGAYRDCKVVINPNAPKPIQRVETIPKVKTAWSKYQEAKKQYFKEKKNAFSELRKRQKEERDTLSQQHRTERSALFAVSWKGKGHELNAQRSIIAAKQQSEKLNLRDRQEEERESLKSLFQRYFPSFKEWLANEKDQESSTLFRYPAQLAIFPAENGKKHATGKRFDLRDFTPVFAGKYGGVRYRRHGSQTAEFIDYGKKIVFPATFDEKSILAALQLATQKWGAVEISGTNEYKTLCVQIAAKHHFKITNPELQAEMEKYAPKVRQHRDYSRSAGWER